MTQKPNKKARVSVGGALPLKSRSFRSDYGLWLFAASTVAAIGAGAAYLWIAQQRQASNDDAGPTEDAPGSA